MTKISSSNSNVRNGTGRARVRRYYDLLLLVVAALALGGLLIARWDAWIDPALMRVYEAMEVREESPLAFSGHVIASWVPGIKYVHAADMDGDGDLDVVSLSARGESDRSQIAWHENAAGDGSTWSKHVLGRLAATGITLRDVDDDGDIDIATVPVGSAQSPWYENDGSPDARFLFHNRQPSTQKTDTGPGSACEQGSALDDLIALLDAPLIRYQDAIDASRPLTMRELISQAGQGHGTAVADLDGDYDEDLLAALGNKGNLSWYENTGQASARLTAHVISSQAYGAGNVCAVDLDGDGDLDVLAGFTGNRIAWWEQVQRPGAPPRPELAHTAVTVAEGEVAVNSGRFGSSGQQALLLEASLGEVRDEGNGRWSWSYLAPDGPNSAQAVTITAREGQNSAVSVTFQLVVENVPPQVALSLENLVEPGDAALGGGSFADPGADTWQASVDYGDGTGTQPLSLGDDGTFELIHSYDEQAEYVITVCVQDDDRQQGCASSAVTVAQELPGVGFTNRSGPIREGETAELAFDRQNGAGSTEPDADWRFSYDCTGDGVYEIEDRPNQWTYHCLYPEDGTYTARGRVKGTAGAQIELRVTVQVDNVAPTARFEASPTTARVGEAIRLSFDQATDASQEDVQAGFRFAYDCTGNQDLQIGGTDETAYPCVYPESGVYIVRARIYDQDGDWTEYSAEVQIQEAVPATQFVPLTLPVYEGKPAQLAFLEPDETVAGRTYSIDCTGDGVYEMHDTSTTSLGCIYPDQGTYTAHGRTRDADGATTEYETEIAVRNAAPTATLVSDSRTVREGESAILRFENQTDTNATDVSSGYRYSFDCDGDGAFEIADAPHASHLCGYGDDGLYEARARIADRDGDWSEYTVQVHVLNVPPQADLPASITLDEGQSYTLVLSRPRDPSPADMAAGFRYAYDCTGTGAFESVDRRAARPTCAYPDDGSTLSRVLIADVDGGSSEYTIRVTVRNVSPTVGAISVPTGPFLIGTEIEAVAEFTDPGVLDVHSARWTWGDDRVSSGRVDEIAGSGSVSGTHAYLGPGLYTIRLEVSDEDGGAGSSLAQVPIHDPAADRASGEVRFDSPMGAYARNPAFSDQAELALSVQYGPGAIDGTRPYGSVTFELLGGGMRFEGQQIDWLVVAKRRVWLAAKGTVNGVGRYSIAADLDLDPAPGRVRVRVWDRENDETMLYDSQPGAELDAAPTTPLTKGHVVIPNR